MNIDNNNLQKIKELAGRIEYDVIETTKKVLLSSNCDDYAWVRLQDTINDEKELLLEKEKDGLVTFYITNRYKRDYQDVVGLINFDFRYALEKILTKKEYKYIADNFDFDYIFKFEYKDFYSDMYIDYSDDIEYLCSRFNIDYLKNKNKLESILEKVNKKIKYKSVTTRGHSQGEADVYDIFYVTNDKETENIIDTIVRLLDFIFTPEEVTIYLETTEKRQYKDGFTDDVVTDTEHDSVFNFDGYDTNKKVIDYVESFYQGYEIVDNI